MIQFPTLLSKSLVKSKEAESIWLQSFRRQIIILAKKRFHTIETNSSSYNFLTATSWWQWNTNYNERNGDYGNFIPGQRLVFCCQNLPTKLLIESQFV